MQDQISFEIAESRGENMKKSLVVLCGPVSLCGVLLKPGLRAHSENDKHDVETTKTIIKTAKTIAKWQRKPRNRNVNCGIAM